MRPRRLKTLRDSSAKPDIAMGWNTFWRLSAAKPEDLWIPAEDALNWSRAPRRASQSFRGSAHFGTFPSSPPQHWSHPTQSRKVQCAEKVLVLCTVVQNKDPLKSSKTNARVTAMVAMRTTQGAHLVTRTLHMTALHHQLRCS
jgi:diadenosine tetraphosphatase ApaH/serine/threonine PP2A family protein phosphatase